MAAGAAVCLLLMVLAACGDDAAGRDQPGEDTGPDDVGVDSGDATDGLLEDGPDEGAVADGGDGSDGFDEPVLQDVADEDLLHDDAADDGSLPDTPEDGVGADVGDVADAADAADAADEGDVAEPPTFTDCSGDAAALAEGLTHLSSGSGLPSRLIVLGERACIVARDTEDDVVIASSRLGDGRVVVAGHGGFISDDVASGRAAWLEVAADWASGGVVNGLVALDEPYLGLQSFFEERGWRVELFSAFSLVGRDLIVLSTDSELDGGEIEAITAFVEAGGGLLAAGQAWYWAQSNPGFAAESYPGNRPLVAPGIVITESPAWAGYGTDLVLGPAPDYQHHRRALELMFAELEGTLHLSAEAIAGALETLGIALEWLPLSRTEFYARAQEFSDAVGPVEPTADSPVRPGDAPEAALAARIQSRFFELLPADEVGVYGEVADFPGAVSGSARTVDASVTFYASYEGRDEQYVYSAPSAPVWRSTGLYAPPGQVVSIRVPGLLVDSGADVLIGAWTDLLWQAEQWDRFPAVTRTQRVDATELEVASAFGGPIYFRVPVGAVVPGVTVDLSGVLPMPSYRHGVTTGEEWATDLAESDVPWTEVETNRVVLTVPVSAAAEVADPVGLADLWVDVLDACAALEVTPATRPRAERLVVDRQISGGWMHSGYPIMATLASTSALLDQTGIETSGSWGAFHELGHNHQWADWVLPGTVESSCNLWSVYVSEEVLGISRDDAHPELDPAVRAARLQSYVAGGADFSEWQVWVALETYLQLQEAFGWELYQAVFPQYRALSEAERPGSDSERIDLWVLLTSQAAGVDLGPFYVAWGLPVSEAVLSQTAELPEWVDDPMR